MSPFIPNQQLQVYRNLSTQIDDLANKYRIGKHRLAVCTQHTNHIDLKMMVLLGIFHECSIDVLDTDIIELFITYRKFISLLKYNHETRQYTYELPNSGIYHIRIPAKVVVEAFERLARL